MRNNFYVYIYLDPRKSGLFEYGKYKFDYEPFYVGKGKDDRINDKKNDHCEYKINKIKRLGFETIRMKIIENLEENYSFEVEKELIKLIGKENLKEGPLTNLVDGGDGTSGYKFKKEIREIIAEKQRKEYSIIKKKFEKGDYELTTEEKDYKNAHQKLEYIHRKCGNKNSITWTNFQQGYGCPVCGREERVKKQRKKYLEIKNSFEREKYQLVTEEKDYKNAFTKLEYIHRKCGNKNSITWSNFQQGHRCPICGTEEQAKKRRKKYSYTKLEFERRKCILKTKEEDYKNNRQKLEYDCPNGHNHSIRWNDFKRRKNNYCPKCNRME